MNTNSLADHVLLIIIVQSSMWAGRLTMMTMMMILQLLLPSNRAMKLIPTLYRSYTCIFNRRPVYVATLLRAALPCDRPCSHWRRQELSLGGCPPLRSRGKVPQKLKQFANIFLQILTVEMITI